MRGHSQLAAGSTSLGADAGRWLLAVDWQLSMQLEGHLTWSLFVCIGFALYGHLLSVSRGIDFPLMAAPLTINLS